MASIDAPGIRPDPLPRVTADARFVPYHEASSAPHAVVDGPATEATVLGLSHWPDGATPASLAADTSTGIVARYLAGAHDGPPVATVTNNHFDEDGLIAAWLLLERPGPEVVPAAVAAAEAGDFRTWTDPGAARAALAMMAAAERATTPFPDIIRALNRTGGHDPAGAITLALLPHVGSMLGEPERFRRLWEPVWRRVEEDIDAIDRDPAVVTEVAGADLAVVRADRVREPLAVFPRTGAMRVLWAGGDGRFLLEHRYETWVRYVSRPLPPRRDLAPAAAALNRTETAAGAWRFAGVEDPVARLAFVDGDGAPARSALDLDAVVSAVTGAVA